MAFLKNNSSLVECLETIRGETLIRKEFPRGSVLTGSIAGAELDAMTASVRYAVVFEFKHNFTISDSELERAGNAKSILESTVGNVARQGLCRDYWGTHTSDIEEVIYLLNSLEHRNETTDKARDKLAKVLFDMRK